MTVMTGTPRSALLGAHILRELMMYQSRKNREGVGIVRIDEELEKDGITRSLALHMSDGGRIDVTLTNSQIAELRAATN